MNIFKEIDKTIEVVIDAITILLLSVLLLLLLANIFLRIVPIYTISWYNEVVELCFAWFIFIGAAGVWRKKDHSFVEYLPNKLANHKYYPLLQLVIELLSLQFALVFTYFTLKLTISTAAVSPILQLPKRIFYVVMPISGLIMTSYTIRDLMGLCLNYSKGKKK